jgi:hypothetical protein
MIERRRSLLQMNASQGKKPKPPIWPVLVVLFGLPAAMLVARTPGLPTAELLNENVSLVGVPDALRLRLVHVLFVPLGAMLVVFTRLTLGLRVLGPFRSILLALAFQVTGVWLGLAFLGATIAIVMSVRPLVRSLALPYFGRITVMLSIVAVLMVGGALVGSRLDFQALETIVYFPVVVLCLVADAVARTMKREGIASAIWRATLTAVVAVILAWLVQVPWITEATIRCPELLVAQIGGIVFISRLMAWRAFQRLNPVAGDEASDEQEEDEADESARNVRTAQRCDRGAMCNVLPMG